MQRCRPYCEVAPIGFSFTPVTENEPPHVHVERDDCEAKFWLDPTRLQRSYGFSAAEINRIEKLVVEYHQDLLEAWNEFFND